MFKKLDDLLDSFLTYPVPWNDCIVCHKGEVIYRRFAGFTDAKKTMPVTGKEKCQIFSCSKLITCSAALQLWEKGAFQMEDELALYLPEYAQMKVKTPDIPTHLLTNPEQYITRMGKFLRKTSLDELPQLWNILKGDTAGNYQRLRSISRAKANTCGNTFGKIVNSNSHNEKQYLVNTFSLFWMLFIVNASNSMHMGCNLIQKVQTKCAAENTCYGHQQTIFPPTIF